MEEKLNEVSILIDNAKNVPLEIKGIVKAICRGYIRESKGLIPLSGIMNVCNTMFNPISENNLEFRNTDMRFAETETNYDENCNVIHKLSYINYTDYIKLISILCHELGHVITESNPCEILENGIYPIAKRTTTLYFKCIYENGKLFAQKYYGFRMADGFLESICSKIFMQPEFRLELFNLGYDLKDYIYKDERIFPSRSYDEYRACFELFDYIMNGDLFKFSSMSFNSNQELSSFINEKKILVIFDYLDKSNDLFSKMKEFEGKDRTESFDELLNEYLQAKDLSLSLADMLMELYQKDKFDLKYQELLETYKNTLKKQKLLPIDKAIVNHTI